MATWYINGDTGSDAAAGTSLATAYKTFNALVLSTGDTVVCVDDTTIVSHSTSASASLTVTGLSNITIQRSGTGTNKPKVRGYIPITGAWTDIGGGVYTKAIPTDLTVTGLVYNWESQTANSQHYGHMRLYASAAAVVAAASGDKGKFFYQPVATGLITAYFGGADPNAATLIGYVCSSATVSAILFDGGTNNRVQDIDFGCYPVHSGQFGWAVMFKGCTNSVVSDCDAFDMGAHSFGTLSGSGNSSGNMIQNCRCIGVAPAGTHIVFNGLDSEGTLNGCQVASPIVRVNRWLGIDQLVLDGRGDSVAAVDANTQIPIYAHTDTGTTIPIGGVRVTNVDIDYDESSTNNLPWYCENVVMPASYDEYDETKFPFWVDGGSVSGSGLGTTNWATGSTSKAIAVTRVAWKQEKALTAGQSPCAMQSGGTYSLNFLWKFCTLNVDIGMPLDSDVGYVRILGGFGGGTQRMNWVHCTIYDRSATATEANIRGMSSNNAEAAKYGVAIGCVLAFKTATTLKALWWNNGQTAANHGDHDNLYFNISDDTDGRYSFSSYPDFGNDEDYIGAGKVDTGGTIGRNNLSATPIASETTLELTTTAKALKRLTTTGISSGRGINGRTFDGTYGAFQYGTDTTSRGRDSGTTNQRDSWRNR